MDQLGAGLLFEQLGRQVRSGTVALRGVAELVRVGFGIGDQLLNRIGGHRGVHHQSIGHQREHGDGHKLGRVVIELGVEAHIDRQGRRWRSHQGVAIGLGIEEHFGCDVARSARLVFNHDRLPQLAGQGFRDQAGEQVGTAACRVGHQNLDGFLRPGRRALRPGAALAVRGCGLPRR